MPKLLRGHRNAARSSDFRHPAPRILAEGPDQIVVCDKHDMASKLSGLA
jgi:hypothetical protein